MKKIEYGERHNISPFGIKAPLDSTPCKITFTMQAPIYLGHPWINFDSLLYYCILQKVLGDEFMNIPNKVPIDLSGIELPLTQTLGVEHCSISFFDDEIRVLNQDDYWAEVISKRFEGRDTDYLKENKCKGKIRRGSGKFRNFVEKLAYITPKKVIFYANGNMREIEHLLSYVTTLGMKRAINALNIRKIKVEKIGKDRSLEWEGMAMRPLPCSKWGAGRVNINLPYKAPYWDKNFEMCIFPCSEILSFGGMNGENIS